MSSEETPLFETISFGHISTSMNITEDALLVNSLPAPRTVKDIDLASQAARNSDYMRRSLWYLAFNAIARKLIDMHAMIL
jgi:hypothetical protein